MRTLETDFTDSELRYYARIVYDSGELDSGSIKELKVTQTAVGSSSGITLGGTPAATLTATIVNGVDLKNKSVQVYISRGESAEISLGVFIINDSQAGEEFTEITGYDAMYSTLEWAYYPSDGVSTAKAVLADVCDQAGLELVLPDGLSDVSGLSVDTGYTYREMLGYMAALLGCNSRINDDGAVQLSWFEESGLELGPSSVYTGGLTVDTADWTLGLLTCSVTTSTTTENEDGTTSTESATETLTSGSGNLGISFENPWMTQTILDAVYDKIGGLSYRGGTVSAVGDLRIEPGDIITVTDKSGTSYDMPVMSVTHSYDGGLKTEISAYADSETESSGSVTGPVTKAMERVTAQMAVYEQLQAQNLKAVNATIESLTAMVATINEAYITTATVETLLADYATVEDLNAATATITTLLADYATVENLDAAIARIDTLDTDVAAIQKAYITSAEVTTLLADYATVTSLNTVSATISDLNTTYAEIDFANVDVAAISTGFVSDLLVAQGIVSDSVTAASATVTGYLTGVGIVANTITAGTLDCANITVTNLSVSNLTVTNLNGMTLPSGSVNANNLEDLLEAMIGDISDTSSDVAEAKDAITEVESIANGKSTTYYADDAPSTSDFGLCVNDVWFDTDGDNAMYMWDGTDWELCQFSTGALAASCITADLIASSAVTAAKIAAGTITATEIASSTITGNNIASSTITATNIAASTITGELIAANTITADNIVAGTITATEIAGSTITGSNIAASTITGSNIAAATITADNIAAGAVTAAKISVDELSALGATIGSFTIGSTAIYSSSDAFGTGSNNIYIGNSGISLGTTFKVTYSGVLTATSGIVGGWTITDAKIYGGDSDTGVAVMQMPTSSTTFVFAAGGTSHTSYADCPFRVTKTGAMIATNATVTGEITATSGTIGGFTISSSKIYGGDSDTGVVVMQKPTSSNWWAFAAGGTSHSSYADCPFRVSKEGDLYTAKLNTAGSFTVYEDDDYSTKGGYIGYLTGSSDSETTTGIGILDATSTNYIIATDSGVRMQSSSASFYVADSKIVAKGSLILVGAASIEIPQTQLGSVVITPSAANTPTSKAVTFTHAFSSAPVVCASPYTSVPGTVVTGVGAKDPTTTGVTIYLTRTDTTSTTVSWIAVQTP